MGKNKKKRLLFVYNPIAGNPADADARLEAVTLALIQQGFDVKVAVVKPKSEARKAARKAIKKGFRYIAVMGGDGTIEAVAPELVGTKVRLGVLGGGTENNIAKSLGIPKDIEGACRILSEGICRKLDVGQIRVGKGKKRFFFEFAAAGLISDTFLEAQKIYRGNWKETGPALVKLIRYQPPRMQLVLDGDTTVEHESSLVTISNTPSFGVGYLVAPDASLEDGMLDVCFYPGVSKTGLLAYFESASHEHIANDSKIERFKARKIAIRTWPKQRVVADGAMMGKGKVKIKVLPGALRVMTGEHLGLAREADDQRETAAADPEQASEQLQKESTGV